MRKNRIGILVVFLLAPYLLGAVGNTSFILSEWNIVSRWILSIISFALFTGFAVAFASLDEDDVNTKQKY